MHSVRTVEKVMSSAAWALNLRRPFKLPTRAA
jgi:hypothetical protein